MRTIRVHTGRPLATGRILELEEAPSRHLFKVLRLRPGEDLRLFNGDGREFAARLAASAGAAARVAVRDLLRHEPPPTLPLNLVLGVSRGERMDFAIQKATELGVTRIQPVFARRSVVQLKGERLARRHDHWRSVLVAACEQSGRCRLPELLPAGPLGSALGTCTADLKLVLFHRGGAALPDLPPPRRGVDLLIGPEGGLERQEIQAARDNGFVAVCLGPRILRTETAPLAGLAAIQVLWGDFRAPLRHTTPGEG